MQKAMKKYFPVFVLPTAIAFIVGNIVPLIMAFYLSFCSFTTVNCLLYTSDAADEL